MIYSGKDKMKLTIGIVISCQHNGFSIHQIDQIELFHFLKRSWELCISLEAKGFDKNERY